VRLLLDTHVLLWWREGSRKLGPRARGCIEREALSVHVSAATAWELAIKSRLGKLTVGEPLDRWLLAAIESSGFLALDVTLTHALHVSSLPEHHGDPFDRMLIAQAALDDLTLVTSDVAFEAYDVRVLDARE
jgi:PIN domain nuclease of toxin-antitoxin system